MTQYTQKCPTCQKPTVHTYRPFCSRRCADIDLGKWLSGSFIIPGSEEENFSKNSSIQTSHEEFDTNTDSKE
ncbi:MAG: DNA gyrase inhibitor YacG [Hyphomicrobium sp.]